MQADSAEDALAQLVEQNYVVELDRFWRIRSLPVAAGKNSLPHGAIQFESEGKRWLVRTSLWPDASRAGDLHRLSENRYALPEHLLQLSGRVVEGDRRGEELSVTKLKTHFQSGRKPTVELLEYFDSIHFTRRRGNARLILDSKAALTRFNRP